MKKDIRVGFAFTGSFCTFNRVMAVLERVAAEYDVQPIVSETSAATDTRFGNAHDFMREMQRLCDKRPLTTIKETEPIGPRKLLDALIIAPCTGNTLAKLAAGVADTSVTMAAKAICAMAAPWLWPYPPTTGWPLPPRNIGELLARKNVYLVPLQQDDPVNKPTSLVAVMERIPETLEAALEGRQLQPVLLAPAR